MTSVIPEASAVTPDPRAQRTLTALYRLYNSAETLLYIGVTDNPDRRFKQHRDSKPWWPQVTRKTIEWHPSRGRALTAEAAAITAETPAYNIDHNPVAASYDWPPAGMPADRVDAIEREASTLPADLAEGIRRAAFDGFTRAQLAAPVMQARVEQDADRIMAAIYPPALPEPLRALADEHSIKFVEWNTSTLPEDLRDKFYGHYLEHQDGSRILVVPAGQDPAFRLHVARALLAHAGVSA